MGTLAAITISLAMYASYMIMWSAVADREYLRAALGGVRGVRVVPPAFAGGRGGDSMAS